MAQSMLEDCMRRGANDTAKDSFDLLSDREKEILQLIAEDHSNKDVAGTAAVCRSSRCHPLMRLPRTD
jgi:DNA-binding NarL/FixJ family response regulator